MTIKANSLFLCLNKTRKHLVVRRHDSRDLFTVNSFAIATVLLQQFVKRTKCKPNGQITVTNCKQAVKSHQLFAIL